MNLVGYTATALSRNDIEDTPTNKNVVDFAIVELKDLQGNLVVMYDDAEGLNPETQKTCDTNGQVTFFAEAGDYDLEINGKAQRINLSSGLAEFIITNTGESVQEFVDSFALKIFQSPADGGLTEIQTRTVSAGEVFEVRNTSDDSLATIYSDAAGPTEIVQNGTDNVSGSDGVVEFYIADGDYYIVAGGVSDGFRVGIIAQDGTESSPSISFSSDMDTGLFRKQDDSIAVTTGGTERMVVTSLGRVGIDKEAPEAKLHVCVDDDVTAGIRSTCTWTGTTAEPYQNNDNTLFETRNKVISDSTNYSWSVSADNGTNDIPAGVTDLGFRKGVYGWAVSKDNADGKHDGTLALQMGVHGLAGFLGEGNAGLGTVSEAIGVRGEINHDAASGTIETATAVEAISVASTGTVNINYGVRSTAMNGDVENWSFHGDGGKLYNQDQSNFGSKYTDLNGSAISARGVNNAIEFGFPSAGYGSAIGATPSEGNPFISFCAEIEAGDTWKTQGQVGFAVVNQLNADSLIFGKLTNPNASGQSLTESFRIDQNNRVQLQETPIIPGFTPASASDTGQTGQVSWDADYIYICVGTNTWKRVAIATW